MVTEEFIGGLVPYLSHQLQWPNLPAKRLCRTNVCLLAHSLRATALAHSFSVSLRGASELTSSFLKFAISSILYNRQIFPKQSFAIAQRFGCEVYITRDEWLEKYLTKFFGQVLARDTHSLRIISSIHLSYNFCVSSKHGW
jgi:hypothetical protein